MIALGYHTTDNASNWLNVDRFMAFLSDSYQQQASNSTSNPVTPAPLAKKPHPRRAYVASSSSLPPTSSPVIELSDSSDTPPPRVLAPALKRKRSSKVKSEPISDRATIILLSSGSEDEDSDVAPQQKSKQKKKVKPKAKKAKRAKNDGDDDDDDSKLIQITRQLFVKTITTLTTIPSCWTVPHPEAREAYLLDLSDDPREWKDSKGNLQSMAVIIELEVLCLQPFSCCILLMSSAGSGCVG